MSLAETRPPWLTTPEELENLVSENGMQVDVNDLRKSRHGCSIVENVLSLILQHLPAPSEYELSMARHHLAVDLQHMFKQWSEEGMKATLEQSFLGTFYETTPMMRQKDLDLREFRPINSPSSSVTMDPTGGQHMSTFMSGSASVVPMKRAMEDEEMTPNKAGKFYYGTDIPSEKDFRCPYNVRDPTCHLDCAGKRFPNPRKLKEHIWRFTKPFKCPNCFEGFGRDKTKAIHCDQRKVKCVTSDRNEYEGSAEQERDKQIELAKNTPQILNIFEQYEQRKSESSSSDPHYQQPYDGESSSGSYNGNGNDNNDDDDDDDDETPERESPRSENSGSFTPVASATTTFPWKPQPPSITLRIPQGPDTYPTPPGDHTSSFSPSQQSIGSPYQQTMNTGDFTPSTNYGLDVGFGHSTPTATRSPVAPFNPDDLYSPTHQRLPDLSIPQILITQDDPVVRSPMMPAGYQHHYPIEQQMGPPPPRQLQQQQQSSNAYPSGSSQAFGGGRGMQQGEVISYGFKTFPPAKFRMRFDRGFE